MELIHALRGRLDRLLGVKSARGVSFVLSIITIASKPLGYARMMITAWAFGTSAGMDSFHLANGIVMLFAGCIGGAMQNSVLPELERLRHTSGDDACRAVCAVAAWTIGAVTALMCAAFAIAPGVLVRFFAGGFDVERIRIGAVMLMWMIPYAAVTITRPLLEIWAMFTERYTLSSLTSVVFNIAAIPTLLVAAPLVGVYSVALAYSAGHALSFVLMLAGLGGVPILLRGVRVPWDRVAVIVKNAMLSFTLSGMGALYMIIDRYFASLLPSGAVASISYGGTLITLLTATVSAPMLFFFARISKAVNEDPLSARDTVKEAMAIVMAYFMPLSVFTASCARPVVSLIYGWGSFGTESIDMTSTVLYGYCFGMTFMMMGTPLHNYAMAAQRMRTIVGLSLIGIAVNSSLNWLLVTRYGLLGLAIATSISQTIGYVIAYAVILRESPAGFAHRSRAFVQAAVLVPLALISHAAGQFGTAAHIAAAAVLCAGYFAVSGRLGLMPMVPPHWRPLALASFLGSSAASYVRRGD